MDCNLFSRFFLGQTPGGAASRHFISVFKKHFGMAPAAYIPKGFALIPIPRHPSQNIYPATFSRSAEAGLRSAPVHHTGV